MEPTPNYRRWTGLFSKALIVESPDPLLDEELRKLGIEPVRHDTLPDEDELVRMLAAGGHNLIFKRSRLPITERVLAASPNLAAVMLCCIGDDSVDKEAAARHGVLVMNDPVSNGRSVAEMVMGELIVASRRIFESVVEMDRSVWKKHNKERYEVLGKRLGVLGLGKIGRQVAQLGQAFGMEIAFYDSGVVPREVGVAMGWRACDSIDDLFRFSDFVSVHVSAEDEHGNSNRNILTYEHFRAFGRKDREGPRVFLNLARGFVVSSDVLRRAVQEKLITYAIVDVYPEEPGPGHGSEWRNPFGDEPRIFGTPHIGASTQEAQPRIARYMARTTQIFSGYGMLRDCVFNPRARIQFDPGDAASVLAVVHVDKRGTKKAVDDAIYDAGASNLQSSHLDFPKYGIAYDVSLLDQPLAPERCDALVEKASRLTGDPTAIRLLRTIPIGPIGPNGPNGPIGGGR